MWSCNRAASRQAPRASANSTQGAVPGGDVVLHDLYWDSAVQRPLMVLTVPVPGQGAFVLEIDPETFLFPAIRSWPGPRRTAEAVLAP
jgi:hypothetical protein